MRQRPDRSPTPTATIGDSPTDHRANTLGLEQPRDIRATKLVDIHHEPTQPNNNRWRSDFLKRPITWITALGLTAGVGIGLNNSNSAERPTNIPVEDSPVDEGEIATPTNPEPSPTDIPSPEAIDPLSDPLSPESLALLQTPDQIRQAFTISNTEYPTPEEYGYAFVRRLEALLNVGSPEELAQFEAQQADSVGYVRAMAERYLEPALGGLYGASGLAQDPEKFLHGYFGNVQRRNALIDYLARDGKANPYHLSLDVEDIESQTNPDGSSNLTMVVRFVDNADGRALNIMSNPDYFDVDYTSTVFVYNLAQNDSGGWSASSIESFVHPD